VGCNILALGGPNDFRVGHRITGVTGAQWDYGCKGREHCCHSRSVHIQLPHSLCISVVIYAIVPECLPMPFTSPATRLLPNVREQVVIAPKPTGGPARARRSIRRRGRRRRSTAPATEVIITSPPRALRRHMRHRRRRGSRGSRGSRGRGRTRRPRIVAAPCIHISVVHSGLGRLRRRRGLGQVERRGRGRRRHDGPLRCRCGRRRKGH
jgi:hypothetical protein